MRKKKLDRRVKEMCVQPTYSGDDFVTGTACYPLDHNNIETDDDQQCWIL